MNQAARARILKRPWEPRTYSPLELEDLLRINPIEARDIVRDINANSFSQINELFVTHHELATYLRDSISIVELPQSRDELSVHGRWLVEMRWRIDPNRQTYRWIDPQFQDRRLTLRDALRTALGRQRSNEVDDRDPNVIDANFEVIDHQE